MSIFGAASHTPGNITGATSTQGGYSSGKTDLGSSDDDVYIKANGKTRIEIPKSSGVIKLYNLDTPQKILTLDITGIADDTLWKYPTTTGGPGAILFKNLQSGLGWSDDTTNVSAPNFYLGSDMSATNKANTCNVISAGTSTTNGVTLNVCANNAITKAANTNTAAVNIICDNALTANASSVLSFMNVQANTLSQIMGRIIWWGNGSPGAKTTGLLTSAYISVSAALTASDNGGTGTATDTYLPTTMTFATADKNYTAGTTHVARRRLYFDEQGRHFRYNAPTGTTQYINTLDMSQMTANTNWTVPATNPTIDNAIMTSTTAGLMAWTSQVTIANGILSLYNTAKTYKVALDATGLTANTTWKFPVTYPGRDGYSLKSDMAGQLSWSTPIAGFAYFGVSSQTIAQGNTAVLQTNAWLDWPTVVSNGVINLNFTGILAIHVQCNLAAAGAATLTVGTYSDTVSGLNANTSSRTATVYLNAVMGTPYAVSITAVSGSVSIAYLTIQLVS